MEKATIMNVYQKATVCLLCLIFSAQGIFGQFSGCVIHVAPFSTPFYDEFAPIYYNHGIVYCSNRTNNELIRFTTPKSPVFKIFYTEQSSSANWKRPVLLSSDISGSFHEGPASVNKDGTLLYFSRNNIMGRPLKNVKDTTIKLGIYYIEKVDGKWTQMIPFIYNDPRFVFTTPALHPDGKWLYFSSDKPGGYGGMDLYYCEWYENKWGTPVNMGPVVNTSGNESFPYVDGTGKLYFSSDKQGMGGKDLFFTLQNNGSWIAPVPLDSAFNSPYDDFGIVIDSTGQSGYFSSNRMHTDDIFQFRTAIPEFKNCVPVEKNNYCYTFYDEQNSGDSIPLLYIWDFGDGVIQKGKKTDHCFPGPGNYTVKLSIIDLMTDSTIISQVEYPVALKGSLQTQIKSVNTSLSGNPVNFYAETPLIEGLQFTGYYWDKGEGFSPDKPIWNTVFSNDGIYTIRLGLTSFESKTGISQNFCITKQIQIWDKIEIIKAGVPMDCRVMTNILLAGKTPHTLPETLKTLFSDIPEDLHQNFLSDELDSSKFLNTIVKLLTDNPDFKLEMMLTMPSISNLSESNVVTEQWAQQLTFFFKKHGLGSDRIGYCAADDFLFTKKYNPMPEHAGGIIEFIIIAQHMSI